MPVGDQISGCTEIRPRISVLEDTKFTKMSQWARFEFGYLRICLDVPFRIKQVGAFDCRDESRINGRLRRTFPFGEKHQKLTSRFAIGFHDLMVFIIPLAGATPSYAAEMRIGTNPLPQTGSICTFRVVPTMAHAETAALDRGLPPHSPEIWSTRRHLAPADFRV
jgi:hypothetical protein